MEVRYGCRFTSLYGGPTKTFSSTLRKSFGIFPWGAVRTLVRIGQSSKFKPKKRFSFRRIVSRFESFPIRLYAADGDHFVVFTSNLGSGDAMELEHSSFATMERHVRVRAQQRTQAELYARIQEKLVGPCGKSPPLTATKNL